MAVAKAVVESMVEVREVEMATGAAVEASAVEMRAARGGAVMGAAVSTGPEREVVVPAVASKGGPTEVLKGEAERAEERAGYWEAQVAWEA